MSDEFKQFLFFLTFPENKRRVFQEVFGLSEAEQIRWEVMVFERRNYCRLPKRKYTYKIHRLKAA